MITCGDSRCAGFCSGEVGCSRTLPFILSDPTKPAGREKATSASSAGMSQHGEQPRDLPLS